MKGSYTFKSLLEIFVDGIGALAGKAIGNHQNLIAYCKVQEEVWQ